MSRFARRQLKSRTVDLLTVDDAGQPELLRVTIRRIDNAMAAAHGLHRLLVMGEAAKQRPAHTPEPVRRAELLANRLRGVRTDLVAYAESSEGEAEARPSIVDGARAAIEAVDLQLAEQLQTPAKGDPQSRAERQAMVDAAYLDTGYPAGLVRLLLAERELVYKFEQAEHEVSLISSGRLVGIARNIGTAGTTQAAEQRAAIVCAAVSHFQAFVVAAGVTRPDPGVPAHWVPHADEPAPVRVQLVREGNPDESAEPPIYPLTILTSSEVSTLAEQSYLHAVGGEEGKAALNRFRQQSPADGGNVANEPRQGNHRG